MITGEPVVVDRQSSLEVTEDPYLDNTWILPKDSSDAPHRLEMKSHGKNRKFPSLSSMRKHYLSSLDGTDVPKDPPSPEFPAPLSSPPTAFGFVLPLNVMNMAPGGCKWEHIRSFMFPVRKTYDEFLEHGIMKNLVSVPFQCRNRLLNPTYLGRLVDEWHTLYLHKSRIQWDDDERSIQPIIHNILLVAVQCVRRSSRGAVYTRSSDCYEVIYMNDDLKVLIEVKGTCAYPYRLIEGARPMSQLLQQVALARLSGQWKNKVLAGLATHDEWNLFVIADCSKEPQAALLLEVVKHFSFSIAARSYDLHISDLVSFFVSYLNGVDYI
jgi:hypothetical protein